MMAAMMIARLLLVLGLFIAPLAAEAQLAEGPWPMYHHDVCHTGQSPYLGPLFAGTSTVPGAPAATDVKIWHGGDKLRTSPSLSKNGTTIYFGIGWNFCAIDAETMATNDCLALGADASDSSPAVAADGTIYIGDRDNSLNAYRSDPVTKKLSLKWRYNQDLEGNDDEGHEGDIWQHPVIAPAGRPEAGTIYFTHDQVNQQPGIFTALIDNGNGTPPTVKWKYKIGNFVKQSSPAIDENGIIYFGDRNGYVYAFKDKGACPANNAFCNNPTKGPVLLWKMQLGSTPGITASPVISADSNTLYIGTLRAVSGGIPLGLTALDISNPCSGPPCPLPPVKWTFQTTEGVDQTPALARDGTLYVPTINMGQGRLYAIRPGATAATLKWVFGPIPVSEYSAQPIVAGDEKVYVGLGKNIYALDPDTGKPLWTYATTNFVQSSPLIGPVTGGKAVVYVPSRDHNLYAISKELGTRPNTITPTTCWANGSPTVGNDAPVANAGPDQSVTVNQPVTFNGAGSHDPNGDPLTVTWNFGDGVGSNPPCLASAPGCLTPTYTYTTVNPAGYTATLTVSDGQLSDTDTVKITVAFSTFTDVPPDHVFFSFVEALAEAGITGGCSTNPPQFCPDAGVTRGQMAVFLLRGMHGAGYQPPPLTDTRFADVPISHPFARWIEELALEAITAGCDTSPLRYCPEAIVDRGQMAVFLLRAKHGPSYQPPLATGMFQDVPTHHPFAQWIEQLAREGITSGCNTAPARYCPGAPVTRGQMAVFLVRAFQLPL
jgi:outer membrane protein assembly factor BamB